MRQFDLDIIKHITFFENRTKAKVRDCIVNGESIYFLVEAGEMRKALGSGGSNVRSLQSQLGKRLRIWEYDSDPKKFVKNLIPQGEDIKISGTTVTVSIPASERGKIIGKEGSNIKNMKEILKRNSDIENIDIK